MSSAFDRLQDDEDALFVSPLEEDELDALHEEMSDAGLARLPDAYIAFLRQTNGMSWNGVEFFGSEEVYDEEEDYTLIDLITANEEMAEIKDLGELLVVGQGDEEVYAYDPESERFLILDRIDLAEMGSFASFNALFEDVIGGLYEGIDALDSLDDDDDDIGDGEDAVPDDSDDDLDRER